MSIMTESQTAIWGRRLVHGEMFPPAQLKDGPVCGTKGCKRLATLCVYAIMRPEVYCCDQCFGTEHIRVAMRLRPMVMTEKLWGTR